MHKILVADLDGAIVDFNSGYAKLLNKIQGNKLVDPLSDSHLTEWDWDVKAGFDVNTIAKAWVEISNSGVFWQHLFPYSTAYDDFKALQQFNGDTYFCTKRPGFTAKRETEQWLRGHGFSNPTVVICEDKQSFCKAVGATMIVDDKPENLMGVEDIGVLFKRPWNARWRGHVPEVDSYKEALNAL